MASSSIVRLVAPFLNKCPWLPSDWRQALLRFPPDPSANSIRLEDADDDHEVRSRMKQHGSPQ
jgi:hypothetical protein